MCIQYTYVYVYIYMYMYIYIYRQLQLFIHLYHLVGGIMWYTYRSETYESVGWDATPNRWNKTKHLPNNKPDVDMHPISLIEYHYHLLLDTIVLLIYLVDILVAV